MLSTILRQVELRPLLKHGLPTGVSDYLGDFFGATSSGFAARR
jgi:hypothetical protein